MRSSRPMYETGSDLAKERGVATALSAVWNCDFRKLPTAYYVDWLALRGKKTSAFVEVKCRNNPSGQYPTLMLSLAKWMHGLQLAAAAAVPFLVVVQWSDGIFFHKAGDAKVEIGFGGRADRGDAQDMEPVVFIPTSEFKRAA